jgi:hypothetical protein
MITPYLSYIIEFVKQFKDEVEAWLENENPELV